MKLIFLDFDGVINSSKFYEDKEKGVIGLDPKAVALVNEICDRTGALVVVSSSWRHGESRTTLQEILGKVGFTGKVLGMTPDLSTRHEGLWTAKTRGDEIFQWIEDSSPNIHGPIESFVILDDDSDMEPLAHRHIKTDHAIGLTSNHVERAVTMLGSK